MSGPYEYRSTQPELSSSSPLHNLQGLSSSPPISPGSPTPAYRRSGALPPGTGGGVPSAGQPASRTNTLGSPTTSNPHPFSGSAKASLSSHPSFGKGQLRSKHLRNSPQPPSGVGQNGRGWVLPSASSQDGLGPLPRRAGVESVLEQHFHDSSDDNPSSDDPSSLFSLHSSHDGPARSSQISEHAPDGAPFGLGIPDLLARDSMRHSSMSSVTSGSTVKTTAPAPTTSTANLLGAPFGGAPPSPSQGRSSRVRTFSRIHSSSQDPFSAGAGSSVLTPGVVGGKASPRANRAVQRRKLTGSSPRQLSRSDMLASSQQSSLYEEETGPDGRVGMSDSDGDEELGGEGFDHWDRPVSRSPMQTKRPPAFDWQSRIDTAFEMADGALRLDDCGIKKIDPIVADLSKFVHVPRHRSDGVRSTFSRTSSLANASDRLANSSAIPDPNSPARVSTAGASSLSSSLSSNVELYLARNRLSALPSALFSVTNIVVLSIRGNAIKELPPAIGQLIFLRELNIAQNQLTHLPAEIQRLQLDGFYYFPNPFKQPEDGAKLSLRPFFGALRGELDELAAESGTTSNSSTDEYIVAPSGSMGPPPVPARLRSHPRLPASASFAAPGGRTDNGQENGTTIAQPRREGEYIARYLQPVDDSADALGVPSLAELCLRRLLRTPMPADMDEADTFNLAGVRMLLEGHDADTLSTPHLPLSSKVVKALEAARRSAVGAWGRTRPTSQAPWYDGVRAVSKNPKHQARKFDSAQGTKESVLDDPPSTPPAGQARGALESFFYEDEDEGEGEASGELSSDSDEAHLNAATATSVGFRGGVVDVERDLDRSDNSMLNPWFNRCPNPQHAVPEGMTPETSIVQDEAATASGKDWPLPAAPRGGSHIYSHHSVERIEWVSHIGGFRVGGSKDGKNGALARDSGCLPIRWRGCSPHCLAFLNDV